MHDACTGQDKNEKVSYKYTTLTPSRTRMEGGGRPASHCPANGLELLEELTYQSLHLTLWKEVTQQRLFEVEKACAICFVLLEAYNDIKIGMTTSALVFLLPYSWAPSLYYIRLSYYSQNQSSTITGFRGPSPCLFTHPNLVNHINRTVPMRWEFKGKLGLRSQS